jgi:hypothetical protein
MGEQLWEERGEQWAGASRGKRIVKWGEQWCMSSNKSVFQRKEHLSAEERYIDR